MHKLLLAALTVFLNGPTTSSNAPNLKTLYVQHRWFELRDAIKDQGAPALYEGAVAAAFNDDNAAAAYLNGAIQAQPSSDDAKEAHEILAKVYGREGKYKAALQQLDEILKMEPDRADVENVRTMFAAWSKHPDQSIPRQNATAVRADVRKDGVRLPVSIHGKTVHWLLDTGFNFSMMSESEARRLGIAVYETPSKVFDAAGEATTMRTAVVKDIGIGDFHIRNVAFLIMPDAQEPMRSWPPGERGIIGLPVAIAFGNFSWRSDGTFQIRPAQLKRSEAVGQNLCFDGFTSIVRVGFQGKELEFGFDTGDQAGSQLWTRFAHEFPTILEQQGTRNTQRVEQVGGANERPTILLPEVTLQVGGLQTELRPAQVFSKPIGDDFRHGLLGMDVFSQASEVQIDFTSMTVILSH